jgi:hypothetical protein
MSDEWPRLRRHWVPDDRELRPYAERVIAEEILTGAGYKVGEVESRPRHSSPDCEAEVDDRLCGIEVTELVDTTVQKAKRYEEDQGIQRHVAREWTPDDFRNEVDPLLRRKAAKVKGWADDSRYSGRLLVIHTNEFYLSGPFVTEALRGHEFDSQGFCAAVLGLAPHPWEETIFRIPLRQEA